MTARPPEREALLLQKESNVSYLRAATLTGCLAFLPTIAAAGPTPSPSAPPVIYHVVTSAFCERLQDRIRPAVALILETDPIIAKSPPLFNKYQNQVFAAADPMKPYDSINAQSPGVDAVLQRMSYLVHPIAQNIIAAQTILGKDELVPPTGNSDDDKRIADLKTKLLQTIATQNASLDLINGFVQTQQLGEIQHFGTEYIASITNTGVLGAPSAATPAPGLQDPDAPGVTQNPYAIDPAQIPGLAVGYNPLQKVIDGLQWTRAQTQQKESAAADAVMSAVARCAVTRPTDH
jgi:hypothetical protein